jgi:hypothetical protein
MPYSTIKTFLMIGATVAAIGATTPLAQAQTDEDIVDRAMHRAFECVQGKRPWDEEPCPNVAALLQWSNRPMQESPTDYKQRTGHAYGARGDEMPLCRGRMTRDGCQR